MIEELFDIRSQVLQVTASFGVDFFPLRRRRKALASRVVTQVRRTIQIEDAPVLLDLAQSPKPFGHYLRALNCRRGSRLVT